MTLKHVLLEKEDGIAVIRFHRPEALNALNSQVLEDIAAAVENVAADEGVRVVIFTGEGKSFISGADIHEMDNKTGLGIIDYSRKGAALFRRIETMTKPTIAAVNGYAFGGGFEFVLCTDIRIAHEKASFRLPEVSLGIVPGFNGTQRLPKCIGMPRAKELIFTCDRIDAQEAYRIGLANKVVPAAELMDTCFSMAERILSKGSYAVSLAKLCIETGMDTALDSGLDMEATNFGLSFATGDKKEGMTAFLEKRAAVLTEF